MPQKVITLCYRKIIDSTATNPWDKFIHEDSFTELKMQSQFYNQEGKHSTFAEIILNVPGSEKLHFLVSAAITGYLQQLNGIIPDVLDNLGRRFLTFENFKFEIINSDLNQIDKHKVAINFFSRPLLWHDSIDQYLLVSAFNKKTTDEIFTNLFQIQPFVSIHAIKNIS
ncbi:hypothetical protein EV200_102584 [Pedobacter psychrotolerans]|uniref:Uncharacterized protein n=1 Tax=Pedobacter psychrotolerans TaxID=1843235 RepID=A0A4R2HIV2_9SPHI|nr:hypothetical protein [Pedobacter psychrotolerans]TCO29162.1 hypothetical protein EV200_102584 [Pedobacter psychrotolerans]GGE54667.1 hypothetical protein GCM10011413_21270 [Pedobacter psychrotolerans]